MRQVHGMNVFAAALFAAAALVSLPGAAQDKKIVLRVADQFPTTHFFPRYGIKPWMEQVTKATNGEVQFEHYPAEQLGKAKDLLSLVQSGVADIVLFAPSYASDKMPLTAALELPGLFDNSCHGTKVLEQLGKGEGILAKREYAPNGVRVLFGGVYPPYQLVSAKRPIDSPRSIEGMKLRVLGGAMELTVQKLKGTGVKMASTDAFEAISRGTLDGAIFSYGVTANYNIPAKYVTQDQGFGAAAAIFIIGENRWKALPEHVKKAMAEAGTAASAKVCAGMDQEEAADLQKLKERGVTVVRWTADDKKQMEEILKSVAQEWASGLDQRSKPGSETLKAVLESRG